MTITAKYAGKCTKCGGRIRVGEQINWEPGKGASHVSCPANLTANRPATQQEINREVNSKIGWYLGQCDELPE